MKRLGKVLCCGIEHQVVEGTREEFEGLESAFGYLNPAGCQIVLREGLAPQIFQNTLLHEVQHAIWLHSGLQQMSGQKWDTAHEFEEAFIQAFTPHWIAAIKSMRKWKIR